MAHFTKWLNDWRAGHQVPFPPAAAEELAERLFKKLDEALSGRIRPEFGFPTPAELISDGILDLLSRDRKPGDALPEFVVNLKTLSAWLFRGAWWRICREARRRRASPAARGLSAAGKLPDGSIDPLGMNARAAEEVHRGDVFAVEEAGLAVREALDLGMADLRLWKGQDWVFTFEQVCLQDRLQEDVAGELGIAPGSVSRRLGPARFCIARRMGFERDQLVKEFGEDKTLEWTKGLEKALGNDHGTRPD